jgi:hypothetical protein
MAAISSIIKNQKQVAKLYLNKMLSIRKEPENLNPSGGMRFAKRVLPRSCGGGHYDLLFLRKWNWGGA